MSTRSVALQPRTGSRVPPDSEIPGPHPEPPTDLGTRPLPIVESRGAWFRIHRLDYEPLFFGRSGESRFDARSGEYGVLYVAADPTGAFVETLGRATGERLVSLTELRRRGLSRITVRRPLRLVDLTGTGLAQIGAEERLCAGDYAVAQRWSLTLWQHPQRPDGLAYRSRHDPSRVCAAIYDRAASSLRTSRQPRALADPKYVAQLAALLETYGFGLVEDAR